MLLLSGKQKIAAFTLLTERHGWECVRDVHHPTKFDRCWLTHPELKPRVAGDSRQMFVAAETAMEFYTELTASDLPTTSYDGLSWIWPDGTVS